MNLFFLACYKYCLLHVQQQQQNCCQQYFIAVQIKFTKSDLRQFAEARHDIKYRAPSIPRQLLQRPLQSHALCQGQQPGLLKGLRDVIGGQVT